MALLCAVIPFRQMLRSTCPVSNPRPFFPENASCWVPNSNRAGNFESINKSYFYTYVPLDLLNMCRFDFGLPGNDCAEDEKTAEEVGRLQRPTSCAVSTYISEVQ